ncbi:MAG: J domain-containing protein [Phycisphaerae bacterium]
MTDYYSALDVPENASEDAIKRAYRQLALDCHPDSDRLRGVSLRLRELATQKFREAAEAYAILSDPERRRTYDRTRVRGAVESERDKFVRELRFAVDRGDLQLVEDCACRLDRRFQKDDELFQFYVAQVYRLASTLVEAGNFVGAKKYLKLVASRAKSDDLRKQALRDIASLLSRVRISTVAEDKQKSESQRIPANPTNASDHARTEHFLCPHCHGAFDGVPGAVIYNCPHCLEEVPRRYALGPRKRPYGEFEKPSLTNDVHCSSCRYIRNSSLIMTFLVGNVFIKWTICTVWFLIGLVVAIAALPSLFFPPVASVIYVIIALIFVVPLSCILDYRIKKKCKHPSTPDNGLLHGPEHLNPNRRCQNWSER